MIEENNEICPIKNLVRILGGKWKMPIICILAAGKPLRNGVIKRRLGKVTDMMLAQSLKELEADGLVLRKQFNEVPPHVEYSLTERGNSVVPLLAAIANWASDASSLPDGCGIKCKTCQSTD